MHARTLMTEQLKSLGHNFVPFFLTCRLNLYPCASVAKVAPAGHNQTLCILGEMVPYLHLQNTIVQEKHEKKKKKQQYNA